MDGRKNNGNKGHSTKSKGVDKRKNEYKEVLNNALTEKDLAKIIKMLHTKSIDDKDSTAAKILLEYYLGKPQQRIDVTSGDEPFQIKPLFPIDLIK